MSRRPTLPIGRRNGFRGLGAIAGGGAFDPLADPDLVGLWLGLDASDNGTTLTVPDRSANGFDLTATGGSGRPSISATGFAGLKAIDFSSLASGWVPLSSSAIGAALTGQQAVTVIALLGPGSAAAAAYVARYGAAAAGDWFWQHTVPNVGQHTISLVNTTSTTWVSSLRSDPIVYQEAVGFRFNGALSSDKVGAAKKDSVTLVGSYTANGAPATTPGNKTLYVGANSNGTVPLKQRWAGMAIVKRWLSDSEFAVWSDWMRSQYALAQPTRILFVGDSICATAAGWRQRVWNLYAADAAAAVQPYAKHQPIGPQGLGATYAENWHDAQSGSRVADCTTRMATTLASGSIFDPHVVWLQAGINDIILDGATAADVAAAWEAFLVACYDLRPNVRYKVVSLINNSIGTIVEDANALGPSAVANAIASRPGMSAEWVDSIYTVALADGTHPTAAGYSAMGDAYYPIIMAL